MTIGRIDAMERLLRNGVLLFDGTGLTDGQLLGRFVDQRDESAFAALVHRHGSMVWSVCRRLLMSHQDAEDAFQATFLILVREAKSVQAREKVANWLYGVAYNTALKAKAVSARRKVREGQVSEMPDVAATNQNSWNDLQPLLDRELSSLPERYRMPIVLCDLEGKTRKEAARQLGWPEGTLSSRLSKARAVLAKKLTRQGLELSGGAIALALSQNTASAAVPAFVVFSTIKAAILFVADLAAVAGAISVTAAVLTEGVLKDMLLSMPHFGHLICVPTGGLHAVSSGALQVGQGKRFTAMSNSLDRVECNRRILTGAGRSVEENRAWKSRRTIGDHDLIPPPDLVRIGWSRRLI